MRKNARSARHPELEASLNARYAQYSPTEIERLAALVIEAIAEAVVAGKAISFIDVDGVGRITFEGLGVVDQLN